MSESPPNSRTSTPDPSHYSDKSAHLKDLILLCTPNKSGQELANIRADLAACVDDQGQAIQHLKHRLVDLENGIEAPRKSSRSRNHRTEGIEEESADFTSQELEQRARRAGRKFVILRGLWLCLTDDDFEAFFNTELDDDYTAELRFSSDSEIRQAQLREVIDTLPVDLESFRKRRWLAMAFKDGMNSQRWNTRNRLRKEAQHVLPDSIPTSWLATEQSRRDHLRTFIGWNSETRKYSIWNAPCLHGNDSNELDYNQVFRHPLLLRIFASIIRGSASADSVMERSSRRPKANTMQRIFGIVSTSPGAIAIWLCSGDETFAPVGDVTGINYYDRYNEYLEKILEGLRRRQKWARDLFVFWDSHLFPETNGSQFGGGVRPDDEAVRVEMEGATDLLMQMPVVSDEEDAESGGEGD
ncbi:hypothetical protein B0H14DRAFT_3497423 [Mycena olivaceomarginata]|nr:hypothetical protein B0H14DRAFT_3497423 [Mycena olivaceomarginata]